MICLTHYTSEVFPRSKAAAQKAVELDDNLAEAHAILGFTIYWYDWDWISAETQIKRALELDPNSATAHWVYAAWLSNLGRHAEALTEIKRARELDPLNLAINTTEGVILINAGQPEAGLDALRKTLELEPSYFPAHLFASGAYIEKGMYVEAVAEATKARELNPVSSVPIAYHGYALAKSGKRAEAEAALEELLKLSTVHYVAPYHIAFLYNGLNEREKTLAWLERGYEERDPKMLFLKVEPKWNNLRADPHFQDLLRRVGFKP
ncbi:MAG: tetratricopeptide repeat protein [Pyrinomonadaceae bacterium]|nr:tetratricopeptide repeat protein [Pyrinomonadaceae bacterium]